MAFQEKFDQAFEALFNLQNSDGGIPATETSEPSGCWTSASVLEALFLSGGFGVASSEQVTNLINFLIITNKTSDKAATEFGGWPLFIGGQSCSMATGHAVSALLLAMKFTDGELKNRVSATIQNGFVWLESNQKSNGGWVAFPSRSGERDKPSVVASVYAMKPYLTKGNSYQNCETIRKGCDYLLAIQNPNDSSWGNYSASMGNVSDTCRAANVLCLSGKLKPASRNISKVNKFIRGKRVSQNYLWDYETEKVIVEGAHAQTIIHKNTLCDLVVFKCSSKSKDKDLIRAIDWLEKSQNEDGFWRLACPQKRKNDIYTWPTSEWIIALSYFNSFTTHRELLAFRSEKKAKFIIWFVAGFVSALPLFWDWLRDIIITSWSAAPEWLQGLLLVSVFLSVGVNLISNVLYDQVKKIGSLRQKVIGSKNDR